MRPAVTQGPCSRVQTEGPETARPPPQLAHSELIGRSGNPRPFVPSFRPLELTPARTRTKVRATLLTVSCASRLAGPNFDLYAFGAIRVVVAL